MSEMKHTPGPWQAEWPDEEGPRYVSSVVTTVFPETAVCVLREDQLADSRLIAAAPDMLDALRLMDAYLYATANGSNEHEIVLAAIAKAEGRT